MAEDGNAHTEDDALSDGRTFHSSSLELTKLRAGFWEKMVVLNAGTLALSFTGAASLQSHMVGDGGMGYYFAAWKMLISAIVMCFVAQWFETRLVSHGNRLQVAGHWETRKRAFPNNTAKAMNTSEGFKSYDTIVAAKAKLALAITPWLEKLLYVLGIAVQITTVTSFVFLFRFAHINMRHS